MSSTGENLTDHILSSADFELKREFFINGNTRDLKFRLHQLKKLKAAIKEMENEILQAVKTDLHKPDFEVIMSEVGLVYQEINYMVRRLKKMAKTRRVKTPLVHFHSVSRIYPQPLGVVLIIGPWNYPFQLLLVPLAGAIAAGNCVVLKPSNKSAQTSAVIGKVISSAFEKNYISVVQGSGSKIVPVLMDNFRFDHIFFSGSVPVGKEIRRAAAEELVPITLELGGKNPVVIDKNVNLTIAAHRIIWGKFLNAGQSCTSPDYLLIHEDIKDQFLNLAVKIIGSFYGSNPCASDHLTHIVNESRMEVLISYLKQGNIIYGGSYDREALVIEPTIIDQVDFNSPLMKEEIFGPILPVITFKTFKETLEIINRNPYPLVLYVFTSDSKVEKYFRENVPYGNGCINHTQIQFTNPHLPFGGIGFSGIGYYHGESSFRTFSHYKSIMKSGTLFDLKLKYPPFTKQAVKITSWFFK